MKRISQIVIAAAVMIAANTVYADNLECNSENLRISGQIYTKYIRMGHSVFSGTLTVFTYKQRVITSSTNVIVNSGDIQDDESIQSSSIFANGVQGFLEINQNEVSKIQIGNQSIQFVPFCKIIPSTTVSNYQSNPSQSFAEKLRVDPVTGQICHPRHPWECL